MLKESRTGCQQRRRGAGHGRLAQRGVTMIELMLGIAVGLIVMAGVVGLLAGQLRGNQDLIGTIRLNNELRSSMDLIVRDLRRASYWGNSLAGVWYPNIPQILDNPFLAIDTATAGAIRYAYDIDSNGVVGPNETFRIRRDAAAGTIEIQQLDAAGTVTGTTPISDADLSNVTGLTFVLQDRTATTTCLNPGAGLIGPTPPILHIRQITATLTGQLRSDPTVTRTLAESVRLRNDWVEGSCPA